MTVPYFLGLTAKETSYPVMCLFFCRRNVLLQIGTPLKPSLLGSDVITLHPKLVGSLLSYYSPTLPPRSAALLRYSAGEKQPLDFCYHLSGGYKGTGHLDSLKELCIK